MKLKGITREALLETIAAENLNENVTFVMADDVAKEPGTIGIGKTKAGNYMVYAVNENGKLFNTSVHTNEEAANEMALRRLRALNADTETETVAEPDETAETENTETEIEGAPAWAGKTFDEMMEEATA